VFTATVAQRCRVYEDVDARQPGPGEVRVRNRAIGLNFVDIYCEPAPLSRHACPSLWARKGPARCSRSGEGVTGFVKGSVLAPWAMRTPAEDS